MSLSDSLRLPMILHCRPKTQGALGSRSWAKTNITRWFLWGSFLCSSKVSTESAPHQPRHGVPWDQFPHCHFTAAEITQILDLCIPPRPHHCSSVHQLRGVGETPEISLQTPNTSVILLAAPRKGGPFTRAGPSRLWLKMK